MPDVRPSLPDKTGKHTARAPSALARLQQLALGRTPVFLSATSEMSQECAAILAAIPTEVYEPFWYERVRAQSTSAREVCAREIERCEAFVLLLGSRFGSPIDAADPASLSIVQWEYARARARHAVSGCPDIQTYWTDRTLSSVDDHRQHAFVEQARSFDATYTRPYASADQLAAYVREALAKLRDRMRRGISADLRRVVRQSVYKLIGLAVVSVLVGFTGGALALFGHIGKGAALWLFGAVALVVVAAAACAMALLKIAEHYGRHED